MSPRQPQNEEPNACQAWSSPLCKDDPRRTARRGYSCVVSMTVDRCLLFLVSCYIMYTRLPSHSHMYLDWRCLRQQLGLCGGQAPQTAHALAQNLPQSQAWHLQREAISAGPVWLP